MNLSLPLGPLLPCFPKNTKIPQNNLISFCCWSPQKLLLWSGGTVSFSCQWKKNGDFPPHCSNPRTRTIRKAAMPQDSQMWGICFSSPRLNQEAQLAFWFVGFFSFPFLSFLSLSIKGDDFSCTTLNPKGPNNSSSLCGLMSITSLSNATLLFMRTASKSSTKRLIYLSKRLMTLQSLEIGSSGALCRTSKLYLKDCFCQEKIKCVLLFTSCKWFLLFSSL